MSTSCPRARPPCPSERPIPATEESRRLLKLRRDRRIDCPPDQVPALWSEPVGKPDPKLDGYRGPRWVLARLDEAAANLLGLPSGWYHTRLTVAEARKLKRKKVA